MSENKLLRRVLLVEDCEQDAVLAMHHLRRIGVTPRIEVVHAGTMAQALELLGREPYDCVLLDLGLPDGDGLDNVQSIRAAARDAAIIVLTGYDDSHTAIAALRCGAQEYLVKGNYENDTLPRVLQHAVERHNLLVELDRQRQRDSFRAAHDPLTGLINRQLLAERAQEMLAQCERRRESFALCFLDLDGFKPVNDSLGHSVGDSVLKEVAGALTAEARSGDTVARIGGDEFVVLLSSISGVAEGERAAQRLVQRVNAIRTVHGHAVNIGVSAGLAIYPNHGSTLEQLFLNADKAMYLAKASGRGSLKVYMDPADAPGAAVRSRPLAVNDANLALLYQPWTDQRSGAFGGVEALLRQRLGGDLVSPENVLRSALDRGLLGELCQWVMRGACQQWRRWQDAGLPIGRLAVNASKAELCRPDFTASTLAILEECGVPQRQLQLEVPEEAFEPGAAEVLDHIRILRAHGVRVVIDGFGRSTAALKHLSIMPIDGVKLDRGMVQALRSPKPGERALPMAIVNVAGANALELIATGIEEQEEFEECLRLGCRFYQGNLLSPPLTGAQLTDSFSQRSPRQRFELIRGGRSREG
ncbi:MAG: EAL domain-containing protein [Nevskia sp.]|nr:EAL domain-containing protein [Nevskia sp.]